MKQSRTMSLVESVANVVVGYVLAVLTQVLVFPWFGIDKGLAEHMIIGIVFVGVSLVRGYLLRRLFNAVLNAGGSDRTPVRYTRFPPKSRSQG